MDFGDFLGNDSLKESLSAACQQDRFAHFYLLTGPAGSGKRALAGRMAAAMVCQSNGEKPCCRCLPCRKALSGSHPDIITVDDPEKKTIPVELIRKTREDLFIRPNEGRRKIYILPRAQDLGLPSQNALLKVLEEPPSYGVFLLLSDNPDKLLPTVRSRCTQLQLRPLAEPVLFERLRRDFPAATEEQLRGAVSRSGGYLGQAMLLLRDGGKLLPQTEPFLQAYAKHDALGLLQVLVPMEKLKREPFLEVLNQWRGILAAALACRAGLPEETGFGPTLCAGRTAAELARGTEILAQAMEYARGNVSIGAICGNLAWQLR